MRLLKGLNVINTFISKKNKAPKEPVRLRFYPKPGIAVEELALALEAMLKAETFPPEMLQHMPASVRRHFKEV